MPESNTQLEESNFYIAADEWLDRVCEDAMPTAAAKVVARTLKRKFNNLRFYETGMFVAWPSMARIQHMSGISSRGTITAALEQLEKLGYITIKPICTMVGDQERWHNVY